METYITDWEVDTRISEVIAKKECLCKLQKVKAFIKIQSYPIHALNMLGIYIQADINHNVPYETFYDISQIIPYTNLNTFQSHWNVSKEGKKIRIEKEYYIDNNHKVVFSMLCVFDKYLENTVEFRIHWQVYSQKEKGKEILNYGDQERIIYIK